MRRQLRNRSILFFAMLLGIFGCTLPPGTAPMSPPVSELFLLPGHFSTQALTSGYLRRKLSHWLAQDNGTALVRELEFARLKHPALMEEIMLADPALYAAVVAVPAVQSQRSNADFDLFMVRLSGVRPSSYQILAVAAGPLTSPIDVVLDAVGNMYVADTSNARIQKITPTGTVSTLASGFSNIRGLGINAQGHVFVADVGRLRVMKVSPEGEVTIIAGTGSSNFSGDGGLATNANLNSPSDVAVDTLGNVYIADSSHHRIRKIDTQGMIQTIAGNGSSGFLGEGILAVNARLHSPIQLVVDAEQNVFFVDSGNHRVRKVTPAGIISTVAGNGSAFYAGDGGLATQAGLANPTGLTLDAFGHLFISNSNVNYYAYIRQVKPDGTIVRVAGDVRTGNTGDGGASIHALLRGTFGLATHPGSQEIFIADMGNRRIRKLVPQYLGH